ncbi:response regulator transcription factor [Flavobacterium sp.]|uniref:response regulator n=1 Tax=Flavobacterium sp. TaxID=239 RepID=UPI003751AD96
MKMSQHINVLIVDDHPFIIQGYKNVINLFPNKKITFSFTEAVDCQTGFNAIMNSDIAFDVAFLDISMPTYEAMNIMSGEDLALLLKKEMPNCKIVILTMHAESLKVESVIAQINPLGLIIKNDLTFEEMILAIGTVLKDEKYYSQAVITYLNQQQQEKIYVDVIDRQILHYINKGIDSEDIPLYITISSSNVRLRKEKMKDQLGMKGSKDSEFIVAAKAKGMLL